MSRGPSGVAKGYIWMCVIIIFIMHCILAVNLPEMMHNLF